jgi:hypothetical protein
MQIFIRDAYEFNLVLHKARLNSVNEIQLSGRLTQNCYGKLMASGVKARMSRNVKPMFSLFPHFCRTALSVFAQRFVIGVLCPSNVASNGRPHPRHCPWQTHRRENQWVWMKFCTYCFIKDTTLITRTLMPTNAYLAGTVYLSQHFSYTFRIYNCWK